MKLLQYICFTTCAVNIYFWTLKNENEIKVGLCINNLIAKDYVFSMDLGTKEEPHLMLFEEQSPETKDALFEKLKYISSSVPIDMGQYKILATDYIKSPSDLRNLMLILTPREDLYEATELQIENLLLGLECFQSVNLSEDFFCSRYKTIYNKLSEERIRAIKAMNKFVEKKNFNMVDNIEELVMKIRKLEEGFSCESKLLESQDISLLNLRKLLSECNPEKKSEVNKRYIELCIKFVEIMSKK